MANTSESALGSREQAPAPHWIAVNGLASIIGMSEKRMEKKFSVLPSAEYKTQEGVRYVNAHSLLEALKKHTPLKLVESNPYLGKTTLKKEINAHQKVVRGIENIIQSHTPQPETLPLFKENEQTTVEQAGGEEEISALTERPFNEFSDEASKERREKLRE